MENNLIFNQIVKTPSVALWNIIPPDSLKDYIEIAEAFKYLEGFPETFFAWSTNVTSFSLTLEAWNALPMRLSVKMEEYFKRAQKIQEEHQKIINLPIKLPLDVIHSNELPDSFDAPDEILEDILVSGESSLVYGDSNCGKTYFVIDIACALARGIPWMGRKTEKGMVIYLASESPASVKRRLQAYHLHHKIKVENFFIVQNPINLFNDAEDVNKIIQLIKILESSYPGKVRLIIGDTLSRLSAGANENAATDMGIVVSHIDKIRSECNSHFLLIHHCGKNAEAGARGWSGMRAAVDTEIEITADYDQRCAEITKQRDLSSKGSRIGFKVHAVTLGKTKWGKDATSCVVIGTDLPEKKSSRRKSEISGAIIEYLLTINKSIKKSELVNHFEGRHLSSSVYKEIRRMIKAEELTDSYGYIGLSHLIKKNTI